MLNAYKVVSGNLLGRKKLGDISINVKIILKRISETYSGMMWTGFAYLSAGISGEFLLTPY
jgi:hypothetical protein